MKPRTIHPRLASLVVSTALLLSFAHTATPQRRQRRTRTTTTPRPTAAPTPQPQTQATPVSTPLPAAGAEAQVTRLRAEPDAAVEELLSAEGFGVYVEVRRVGTLARNQELKTAVGALQLLGEEAQPATDLLAFVSDNADKLGESRAVLAFMPTRAGLPQAFIALELPSTEDAVAFEPTFQHFVGDKVQAFTDTVINPRPEPTPARDAQRTAAERQQTGLKAQSSAGFAFRRVGRLLLTANEPFTLKKLRGEDGAMSLAENVRFQSARSRLASDTVFIYVDTTLAEQGFEFQQQKEREEREKREAQTVASMHASNRATVVVESAKPSASPVPVRTRQATPTSTTSPTTQVEVAEIATTQGTPATPPDATPRTQEDPTATQPTPQPTEETGSTETTTASTELMVDGMPAGATVKSVATTATKPSEEQLAVARMGGLLGNIFRGAPRIPGMVAVGLNLDAGALAIRVAVENTSDGVVSVIPYLPNVIAGPPVTASTADVAPDDTDIFLMTSLDWTRIYTSTLGTASLDPSYTHSRFEDYGTSGVGEGEGEKQPTAEQTVAAIEKLFGFKLREELLPALGNEVAISLPFSYVGGIGLRGNRQAGKKEEKDAEPGFALIVALNDPDKIQGILPRVLAAFDFVPSGAPFAPPEKRGGYEILSTGAFSYTIINNFFVASDDVKSVRHVIDSYEARRTLSSSSVYRDATGWQSQQKIVQIFFSDALMKSAIEETKTRSGGSTDAVVRSLLAQLEMTPEPASYEATNEGDVLLHEVRVPANLLKAYAISEMISVRDASVISNEMMAVYSLNRIRFAEEQFKDGKLKKGSYGTLEELSANGLLEKDFQRLGYKIELNPSGDKFTATATPKTYGKTGRRSFFLDETGEVRGADHAGSAANADDPTVD